MLSLKNGGKDTLLNLIFNEFSAINLFCFLKHSDMESMGIRISNRDCGFFCLKNKL